MRTVYVLAAALCLHISVEAGLPQVAPPGPGSAKAEAPFLYPGSVGRRYDRRLDQALPTPPPSARTPAPATLFPRPGGAVTDTGIPLRGLGGALRDPAGGVWNCNPSGCFSPGGQFFQLRRPRPE